MGGGYNPSDPLHYSLKKQYSHFGRIQKALEGEYIILFRGRQESNEPIDFSKYSDFVFDVSGYEDVNDLYIVSDLLVTDSLVDFFNYAMLKRHIIFYIPELAEHKEEYLNCPIDLYELPGEIAQTEEELVSAIKSDFIYSEKYEVFNARFHSMDDGNATERMIDRCFMELEPINIENKGRRFIRKHKSPKLIIRNLIKHVGYKDGYIVLKAMCRMYFINTRRKRYTFDNIKVCIGEKEYMLSLSLKRGIPFPKHSRLNFYTLKIKADDIHSFDIHNKLVLQMGNLDGYMTYNNFDGKKGKCRNSKVIILGDTAVYFRQSIANNTFLTVRRKNQYDNLKAQMKIFIANLISRFYVRRNIILLFEKECDQYEESASVVYEKLIDMGYDNCYYIIDGESAAVNKIDEKYRKNLIYKGTFQHILYFFRCNKFISTEAMGHALQLRIANKYAARKVQQDKKLQYVFLQHGVMYMVSLDSDLRTGFRNTKYDMHRVVVSSELEAEHFIELGGFEPDQLYITGLAKFDRSMRYTGADKILIMLTWRRWEVNQIREDVTKSKYYMMLRRIEEAVPPEYRDKIVVLLHPLVKDEIQEKDKHFFTLQKTYDSYDEALRECDLLITDYSSISYDAFYRGSNVIFDWAEKDECMKHYGENAKLMLNEDNAFGDVCFDKQELSEAIKKNYMAEQRKEYIDKYRQIVAFSDGQNTPRIIENLKADGIL